jgi:DNA modification methylase
VRELITRPVAELVPYAKNAAIHTDEDVAQIAASITEFGWTSPVLIDEDGAIIAGHGRVLAAQYLHMVEVPTITLEGLTPAQVKAYRLADNRLPRNAGWNEELLALELQDLKALGFNLDLTGFDKMEQLQFLDWKVPGEHESASDELPAVLLAPVSERGTVWQLGPHRVMCGDSTAAEDVAQLLEGADKAALLHADPPYGMGKEADGVLGDNQYGAELDAFQMRWWAAWLPYLETNAAAYIWGNPLDLWRLWHGSLERSGCMTYRNEIVWNKGSAPGMASHERRMYTTVTERCLFFMLGRQAFGNTNKDDYWDGFEPLRRYLEGEAQKMRWAAKHIQTITGVGMYGHWFSKSQWVMIPRKHYQALQEAAEGAAFTRPFLELRAEYDRLLGSGGHLAPKAEFYDSRAYFDNTHEVMTEVWEFSRVVGEERFSHATPKPVKMIERAIKSAAPSGALVLEPFGGTGSTLLAAAGLGRTCYTMELEPRYVDVIVRRWQAFTGEEAFNSAGQSFTEAEKITAYKEQERGAPADA